MVIYVVLPSFHMLFDFFSYLYSVACANAKLCLQKAWMDAWVDGLINIEISRNVYLLGLSNHIPILVISRCVLSYSLNITEHVTSWYSVYV